MSVEKKCLCGSNVAVVTVWPADSPPVKYDGRIWIRTGPRRGLASAQDERILNEKRHHHNTPPDIHPCVGATLIDLDLLAFEREYLPNAFARDVLDDNNRTIAERLSSCRIITSADNPIPTLVGLLTFGLSPQDIIPGSYVQFLRLDGTDLGDEIIDEERIDGNIPQILRRTEEKLASHNRVSIDITSGSTEIRRPLYPMAALLQLLYNAVLHRTYVGTNAPVRIYWFNDRIEIHSPGGPFGNVTAENFGKPGITDYRNPNLAAVMKNYGFIQQFGVGIASARKALEKNGNPPLEFDVNNSIVLSLIRRVI